MKGLFFLGMLWDMWDPSSLTRDWTGAADSESAVLTTGPPGKSLKILLPDSLNGTQMIHAVSSSRKMLN